MVLAATPARLCVCGHCSIRMLAAYACHSICTCIALLGSPHNAVHLSSISYTQKRWKEGRQGEDTGSCGEIPSNALITNYYILYANTERL